MKKKVKNKGNNPYPKPVTKKKMPVIEQEIIIAQCSHCSYSKPLGDRVKCHRFPPSCDGKGPGSVDHQPLMKKEDWCGEFKA